VTDIVGIVLTLVVLRVVAGVGRRFLEVDGLLRWPPDPDSRATFWERTLPWPHGVQEDSDIAWHVPRSADAERERAPLSAEEPAVPPTRPQSRIVGR
jgi:hypothetical protein